MNRVDEIGMTLRTINQLGLMFRWLVDDVSEQVLNVQRASVERVESGARIVDGAGKTMEDIVTQVKRVSDLIAEISSSTAEQSTGVAQVDQAVVHLDNITQQNAALVEQSAAAATLLREQAARLAQTVGEFKLEDRRAMTLQPA
ncbi:methyl-accepting chemotaxis protein [Micrococcus luteus]